MTALFEQTLMQSMTENQRLLFATEMNGRRKDRTVAFLLTFFLGGIGAHRFYLGQAGLGVLYLCFCWLFLPVLISLCELFVIGKRVDSYNEKVATEIAMKVRMLSAPPAAGKAATV